MKYQRFESFAPAILKTYRRDKEAFWAAAMAPFMSDSTLISLWEHRKVTADLFLAFQRLDEDARQVLKDFSEPMEVDVSSWKSNRSQYLKDAYPVFAFLVVWMDEIGLATLIEKFAEILHAGVLAVAGYGILDANVDSNDPLPVEILVAQALIAEYETRALDLFGVTANNLRIMHQMRTYFLRAEIKEKAARGKRSPYQLDNPKDLGTKGANALAPFMLSLEQLGKSNLIEDYWEVFLLFGAAIQIIDDWQDLEGDLAIGHYSYLTLLPGKLPELRDPKRASRILKEDRLRVLGTFTITQDMLFQARSILDRIDDQFLIRFVDITEVRLKAYFKKEFGYLNG